MNIHDIKETAGSTSKWLSKANSLFLRDYWPGLRALIWSNLCFLRFCLPLFFPQRISRVRFGEDAGCASYGVPARWKDSIAWLVGLAPVQSAPVSDLPETEPTPGTHAMVSQAKKKETDNHLKSWKCSKILSIERY